MTYDALPDRIDNEMQLEELLSRPSEAVLRAFASQEGDWILLGVGGKMGPTLARMARRACDEVAPKQRVIGISRFTSPKSRESLEQHGIETIAGDLTDEAFLKGLPGVPNVVHMTGWKFGAATRPSQAWVTNVCLPALVCQRFRESRIMAFSTGNVYPLSMVDGGGSKECDSLGPVGEYAMTALGRERIFEHYSQEYGMPVSIIRLNYAVDLRYGVLVDIGLKVFREEMIDVSMGHVNVIWQGDANAMSLAAMIDASSPPFVVNVAGPSTLKVRDAAEEFGRIFGKTPQISGIESKTALLSDSTLACERYGAPSVDMDRLIAWAAQWIQSERPLLGKPTKFEVRDGKF
jgi:nucleoside-diphosphate-sugar epimerase